MIPLISRIFKKNDINELTYKTEMDLETQKEFTVTFGEEQGVKHRLGSWGWHVHTTIFKIDSHQEPTVKSNNTF